MKKFQINGKIIEIDEEQKFLDFFIEDGKPVLSELNLEGMLTAIASGQVPVDENLKEFMHYLQRWVNDAPRKRMYRKMRMDGCNVLSSEYFFTEEGGDKIIDKLENTGRFAAYFIDEIYGKNKGSLSNLDRVC